MELCYPASIYLVFGVIAIIMAVMSGMSFLAVFFKSVFVLLWTWILNFICKKGYTGVSWALILIPFVLYFIMFLTAMEVMKKTSKMMMMSAPAQPQPQMQPHPQMM